MPEKLQSRELEEIIRILPAKERIALREELPNPETLRERIATGRKHMKRDLWVGPVWLLIYGASLFLTQYSNLTIGIFVVGAAYFIYTMATTGSYGLNRKRVQVYERLLEKMEMKS